MLTIPKLAKYIYILLLLLVILCSVFVCNIQQKLLFKKNIYISEINISQLSH